MYYCHRVSIQLQSTNIYHIHRIISYHIISCMTSHIIWHHTSYHITHHITYHIVSHRIASHRITSYRIVSYRIISYIISHHIVSYHIIYNGAANIGNRVPEFRNNVVPSRRNVGIWFPIDGASWPTSTESSGTTTLKLAHFTMWGFKLEYRNVKLKSPHNSYVLIAVDSIQVTSFQKFVIHFGHGGMYDSVSPNIFVKCNGNLRMKSVHVMTSCRTFSKVTNILWITYRILI